MYNTEMKVYVFFKRTQNINYRMRKLVLQTYLLWVSFTLNVLKLRILFRNCMAKTKLVLYWRCCTVAIR